MGRCDRSHHWREVPGHDRHGTRRWKTVATITEAEPARSFAFHVVAGPLRVAEWAYTFEPSTRGCLVTESWTDQRGRLAAAVARRVTGVADRPTHNRADMEVTSMAVAPVGDSDLDATFSDSAGSFVQRFGPIPRATGR